jgi:hypothetical protein
MSRYHLDRGAGNWLTPEIIQQLHDLSAATAQRGGAGVRLYCFSLVERASNRVAASTFGFSSGGIFEDYTMCTLIRDHRSCGSILNKLVGCILQQVGFSLWYWGYEVEYMKEYISHYGAKHVDRPEFYDVLEATKGFQRLSFADVVLPGGVRLEYEDALGASTAACDADSDCARAGPG